MWRTALRGIYVRQLEASIRRRNVHNELYSIVLYVTVPYTFVSYCVLLFLFSHTVPHCVGSYDTVLCCIVLCVVLYHIVLYLVFYCIVSYRVLLPSRPAIVQLCLPSCRNNCKMLFHSDILSLYSTVLYCIWLVSWRHADSSQVCTIQYSAAYCTVWYLIVLGFVHTKTY